MRSFGFRLTLLVAILWAGIGSTASALGHLGAVETVYVMPSSVSLPVPTSYVVSTSFVEPTAYAVPTYYTTAYWMDPVVVAQPTYAATAYVRRGGLFGRRWVVERPVLTSYVPTTYVASAPAYRSTSYVLADSRLVPSSYVASTECVCPPAVASAAPTYASPSRGTSASGTGSRSRSVTSEADDRASRSSNVGPPPQELNPAPGARDEYNTNLPNPMPDLPAPGRDTSPPPPPAPAEPRQGAAQPGATIPQGGPAGATQGAGTAGQGGGAAPTNVRTQANPIAGGATNPARSTGAPGNVPANTGAAGNAGAAGTGGAAAPPRAPAAPADDLGAPPPIGPSDEIRSQSMKPSTYTLRPVPSQFHNVLIGTVNSRSAGEPEEDVRVSVRNLQTGASKDTTTNAFGRFAVRLTDGDWAVDVTMPSGRVYEVSRLQVSDGQIVDGQGRRVPSLNITR